MQRQYVEKAAALAAFDLSEAGISNLCKFFDIMLAENQKYNLTRIVQPEDIMQKHLLDTLLLAKELDNVQSYADIGTGAGIPGLLIKILFPEIQVLLLDATHKKTNFLKLAAAELGLDKLNIKTARAEELGKNPCYREKYQVVSARAVANMRVLTELCLPFVKTGGRFIAMKGDLQKEGSYKQIVKRLGGEISEEREFKLPGTDMHRSFIIVRKVRPCPVGYPRSMSAIKREMI